MSVSKTSSPCGSWKSPLQAEAIASHSLRLSQTLYDGDDLYFLEGRPSEAGRTAIVQKKKDGTLVDVLKAPFNARTTVHEYGGGSFIVDQGTIYFVNYSDQRLYRLKPGSEPIALTPAVPLRYADMFVDRTANRIVCVCEDHSIEGEECENKIVSIDLSDVDKPGFESVTPVVLAHGYDFYAYPRVSPDGKMLSYMAWRHPNMPWDDTFLHLASLDASGFVVQDIVVAGGQESVFQPSWSVDGKLFFVSDRTDWWNLYVIAEPQKLFKDSAPTKAAIPVAPKEAEFAFPLWVFNMSQYAFLEGGTAGGGKNGSSGVLFNDRIVATYNEKGVWKICLIEGNGKTYDLKPIESTCVEFDYVVSNGKKVAMLAGSPVRPMSVVEYDPSNNKWETIKVSSPIELDAGYLSKPEVIEFPTEGGLTAFAFYFAPTNKDFEVPEGELPPLLVKSHGGPTGATSSVLNLGIQYWTSRGYAVVDVNYGGSTGYGRHYRNRLELNWGVVDMKDCENAAKYLVEKKLVDGNRLSITGGSAGGYTTLCCLTFGDVFKLGASHFGVADAEALCADTHKFEARYGDYLFGPYPEKKQDYYDRSPVHFTDKLNCPVIFFQGLEDKVVPPNQAEAMVAALRKKKLPVAYISYEGEQHGFRKAENIKRTIEAEFYFHSKFFGFKPADTIEPVEIENLEMAASR